MGAIVLIKNGICNATKINPPSIKKADRFYVYTATIFQAPYSPLSAGSLPCVHHWAS